MPRYCIKHPDNDFFILRIKPAYMPNNVTTVCSVCAREQARERKQPSKWLDELKVWLNAKRPAA